MSLRKQDSEFRTQENEGHPLSAFCLQAPGVLRLRRVPVGGTLVR
jgi:hypothetical protein